MDEVARTGRSRSAARWVPVVAAASVLVLATAWIDLSIGGRDVVDVVDDGVTVSAAATATLCCGLAARRQAGRLRVFWLLLAAASFAWTVGECAWSAYDLFADGSVPSPSWADVGYLAAVPLTAAALLVHPGGQHGAPARVQAVLDGAALATAILFLSWSFILRPTWVGATGVSTASRLVSLAYPLGDVVILFLLIRMLHGLDGPSRGHLSWVVAGLFAMTFADSAYSYLNGVRGYTTGHLLDVGWIGAYLGIALGGWFGQATSPLAMRASPAFPSPLALLAPYAPLLIALGVVAGDHELRRSIDGTSRGIAIALVLLVLARQLIDFRRVGLSRSGDCARAGGAL